MLRRGHLATLLCRRGIYYGMSQHYVRYASRKAIRPFLLADIGEGITECEVIKWSVKPSSVVSTFDPLCEVQSDKATVEITSPYDGVIKEIIVKEGEIAKVGTGLCLIEIDEESVDADHTPVATAGKASEDTPSNPPPTQPIQPAQSTQSTQPTPSPPSRQKHPLDPSNTTATTKPSDAHVQATPSVRHYARQMGITDLSVLTPGSGRDGRIEKVDVKNYLERGSAASSTSATEALGTPSKAAQQGEIKIDLGRTRYAMWKAMTKSLEIPHFGYSSTLDLTVLNSMLSSMNPYIPDRYKPPVVSEFPPPVSPEAIWGASAPPKSQATDPASYYDRLTILPLLLKALSRAMQDWPLFRSSLSPQANPDDRPSLTVRPNADIAIAVSTSSGLYTPVIQSVNTKNPYEIMGELRRFQSLGKRVPAGFTPSELPKRGATISVSNVGAIGKGEWAAPLLVPGGGVAIVAIGRAKWVERMGEKRLEVGVSWSADHRIVEGAELAAFVEYWRSWVEEPARLIADGR